MGSTGTQPKSAHTRSKYNSKGLIIYLVPVSKEEAYFVRAEIPGAHIVRTMKKKSKRHKYYCEESSAVMHALLRCRSNNTQRGDCYV